MYESLWCAIKVKYHYSHYFFKDLLSPQFLDKPMNSLPQTDFYTLCVQELGDRNFSEI